MYLLSLIENFILSLWKLTFKTKTFPLGVWKEPTAASQGYASVTQNSKKKQSPQSFLQRYCSERFYALHIESLFSQKISDNELATLRRNYSSLVFLEVLCETFQNRRSDCISSLASAKEWLHDCQNVVRCAIWYHLCNLKNVKNIRGGVLILVKLQAKINTPSWVFFMFFKLYKWYQIAQRITNKQVLSA